MLINNWKIIEQEDTKEVSADIDGFRLWYRLPKSYPVSKAGDAFLAAALLPAMLEGKRLEIDLSLSVSPKLLKNLSVLQEIHHCWNPVLNIIAIDAVTKTASPLNDGAMSFFSGGVDSMFTFLKHSTEISHVVLMNGFDFSLEASTYQTAVARNASFAHVFNKTLIPVETNYYSFGYRYNLSRVLTQGSNLASVSLLLGFPRVYVPSTYSYDELFPWGSHPLTDPLYSTESMEIIHDGAEARRVDKLIKIAEYESALANLTVCLNDMNVNCGKCIKCLRTMIPLQMLHATATRFPPPPPLRNIRRMNWGADPIFLNNNIDLAIQQGHVEFRDALLASKRRYERMQLFKEMDRVILGGLIKRIYRKTMKAPSTVHRITTTPRRD